MAGKDANLCSAAYVPEANQTIVGCGCQQRTVSAESCSIDPGRMSALDEEFRLLCQDARANEQEQDRNVDHKPNPHQIISDRSDNQPGIGDADGACCARTKRNVSSAAGAMIGQHVCSHFLERRTREIPVSSRAFSAPMIVLLLSWGPAQAFIIRAVGAEATRLHLHQCDNYVRYLEFVPTLNKLHGPGS